MGEETMERGNWEGKLDFILSAIGFAVGLGNVWRFPYLAYANGGASFLFPYIIMLIIAGLPLFFMELAVGQFSSEGPITIWKISPIFTGIGFAMVTISGMVCIYYNVIIMYAIYYMMVSFVNLDDQLPWEQCGKPWNTPLCRTDPFPSFKNMTEMETRKTIFSDIISSNCTKDNNVTDYVNNHYNLTLVYPDDINSTYLLNKSMEFYKWCKINWTTPASEYWERSLLKIHLAPGIGNLDAVSLKLCLCLLLSWILIFFCLMKGVKSSGKVVYFTATFPYVIITVLLIRGVTLEGAWRGISFYIIPTWSKLLEPKAWADAAAQIFYSLGPAFGGLMTMASYNKFNNNCYRDACLVAVINCATSIYAGFAIFSLLGHMSFVTNQNVEDVTTDGAGLAFTVYPEGLARLPVAPLWGFLFFFMLLLLGLDSQFVMMETVISGISDLFPRLLRKHKALFTLFCCLVGFVLGIPQVTHGGMYVLTLFNWYCAGINIMIVSFFEIVCIMYVYGIREFCKDIEMMIGHKPNVYWLVNWFVLTPLVILFIVGMSAYRNVPAYYGSYVFEDWAQAIGWLMMAVPIALIVIVAIIQVIRLGWPACIKPSADWGPALPENRTGRYAPLQKPEKNGYYENTAYLENENEMKRLEKQNTKL